MLALRGQAVTAGPASEIEAKPKRVGFQERNLDPEVIADLKRRAERQSLSRTQRSRSREPAEAAPALQRSAVGPVRPMAPGLGAVTQLMDAKGTHAEATRMVSGARRAVLLLGYT